MEFMDLKNVDQINNEESNKNEVLSNLDNNPLKEIPETKVRIYAYIDLLRNTYFDKEEKLDRYIKFNKRYNGGKAIIDYLGRMVDMLDVIRITYSDNTVKYFSVVDCCRYAVYNDEKSISLGKTVWEYEYGDLRDVYNALKKRGVRFENDVYMQQDELFYSVSDQFVDPIKRK